MKAQGESLIKSGIEVSYFLIAGKGIYGYLKNVRPLRKCLRKTNYDIIHAHYGLAAIIALLARKNQKLVVSFMGTDIIGWNKPDGLVTGISLKVSRLNAFFAKRHYDSSIVKSKEMLDKINAKNVNLIPNGVNISVFIPMEKTMPGSWQGLIKQK